MNKALKALKEIEWKNDLRDGQMSELCPICKRSRFMQHAQWCRLGRAIGFLEREPKCKTCGGSEVVDTAPAISGLDTLTEREIPCPDCAEQLLATCGHDMKGGVLICAKCYERFIEQPTDAPTPSPEATGSPERESVTERPSTCPDVPPKAPKSTRQAWDKMDKATEAGEFVKELRKLCYSYEDGWDSKNCPHPLAECAHKLGEACDMLDRLEEKIKFYEKYDKDADGYMAEAKRLKAQVKHTVDYCKVQIAMSAMSISAAAAITGLSWKEVDGWPMIDTSDCKTLSETIAKTEKAVKEQKEDKYYLPKPCPSGGEHKWKACCSKCDMKIWHNLAASKMTP